VADESVPMLWGGFLITADIDTDDDEADGVVFALGDWFGGYALYLVDGQAHFTFARAADTVELTMPSRLGAGRHALTASYEVGEGGDAGRMLLLADGVQVDETAVGGMLPLAVQHGGAGLRLGWDSGFPVSSRYAPPAPFSGTVHGVRVDTAGSTAPGPADQVRTALHAD
jgi:arylsulfatase